MNPEELELIAVDARIDQARAKASEQLDEHIARWQEIVKANGGSDTVAFSGAVQSTVMYVDPQDEMPDEQSNNMCSVAEVLAVAIARLAQAPAK